MTTNHEPEVAQMMDCGDEEKMFKNLMTAIQNLPEGNILEWLQTISKEITTGDLRPGQSMSGALLQRAMLETEIQRRDGDFVVAYGIPRKFTQRVMKAVRIMHRERAYDKVRSAVSNA